MLTTLFLFIPLPPAYLERRGLACELLIVLKSRPDASCSITSPDRPPTAAPAACHFSTSADARDVEGAISHPAVVLRAGARLLLLIGRGAISLRLRPARGFGSRLIGIFLDVCARRRRGNLVGGIRALRRGRLRNCGSKAQDRRRFREWRAKLIPLVGRPWARAAAPVRRAAVEAPHETDFRRAARNAVHVEARFEHLHTCRGRGTLSCSTVKVKGKPKESCATLVVRAGGIQYCCRACVRHCCRVARLCAEHCNSSIVGIVAIPGRGVPVLPRLL